MSKQMTVVKKSKIGAISILQESETDGALVDPNYVNVNDVDEALLGDEKPTEEPSNVRWLALFLCCFTFFGSYFNLTLFQSLQSYIMEDFGMSLTDFNSISSISAIPVMFLPFLSGIIVDRFGLRKTYCVACFLSLSGYGFIALGIYKKSFTLLVVGNVISSVGDAPLGICKNAMLVKWFVGKELSLALGLALCVCRLGSSLSSFFSPMIYKAFDNVLLIPFFFGIGVSTISFISTLGLTYLDLKTDNENQKEQTEEKKKPKPIGLKDLKKFRLIYFLMMLNIGFTYTAVFGFTSNANDMMKKRFGFTPEEAGRLLTIIYICPLIITPTVGALTDKYGKRMLVVFIGSIVLVATHFAVLMLKDVEKEGEKNYLIAACLLAIGICYSSYAGIIWPCVALIVTEKLTGLAYGLIGTFQTGLGVVYPLGLGYIHDHTDRSHGYYWYQVALTGVAGAAFLFAFALFTVDQRGGGKLNKPGTKRKLSIKETVYSHISTGKN